MVDDHLLMVTNQGNCPPWLIIDLVIFDTLFALNVHFPSYVIHQYFALVVSTDYYKYLPPRSYPIFPRSMSSRDPKLSYVGVTFHSRLVVDWLAQLRTIVVRCATRLRDLRPEYVAEGKRITRSLLVLITFTATGMEG